MADTEKNVFLSELKKRYGRLKRVSSSQSLYDICNDKLRLYIRYSKIHGRGSAFYGLRRVDLDLLEGRPSLLCFLWDNQEEPLLIPFSEYEEVFRSVQPAGDGQYKVQIYFQNDITELYVANAGRFNVESYFGWSAAESLIDSHSIVIPDLTHSQVQTIIASLGASKGHDIWLPRNDRSRVDWELVRRFDCASSLPCCLVQIKNVAEEIDVIWTKRGSGTPTAFFEVEHSTPIYSGLLRFNDIHILSPKLGARFSIVSNDDKRSRFIQQLNRPTFRASGLVDACNFLEYRNIFLWHRRLESLSQ